MENEATGSDRRYLSVKITVVCNPKCHPHGVNKFSFCLKINTDKENYALRRSIIISA